MDERIISKCKWGIRHSFRSDDGEKDDATACGQPYFSCIYAHCQGDKSNGTIKKGVLTKNECVAKSEWNAAKIKRISKFSRLLIYGGCMSVPSYRWDEWGDRLRAPESSHCPGHHFFEFPKWWPCFAFHFKNIESPFLLRGPPKKSCLRASGSLKTALLYVCTCSSE